MMEVYIILFGVLLLIAYSLIENRFIKTVRYPLQLCKNRSVKVQQQSDEINKIRDGAFVNIVQISDLHNCSYGKNNNRLLKCVLRCNPDVILITGDMINKYRRVPDEIYTFLERLVTLCPCIYSFGNHELKEREKYPERFSEYINKIKKCGIIVSDNERHRITIKGIPFLFLAYSSDICRYRKSLYRNEKSNALCTAIPDADGEEVAVLLSHDPELTEQYLATNYSLVFSGHLHGGVVRVPGWRGIISTRFVLFPKYDGGCYCLDDKHVLVVSRGLGSHTIKFRLFNRPELVHAVIEIMK